MRRFGTDYAALQRRLLQPGGPPGELRQKILAVRTASDFARHSVEHTVNRLSQNRLVKHILYDHALDCTGCTRGILPSLSGDESRLRHVLSVLKSYQSLPYIVSWGAELSLRRPTVRRTGCSISHLRQQVETWECATYEGLNGLPWRYAETINDVRSPSAKSATNPGEEMGWYSRVQYEHTLAHLCWVDLRTYLSLIEAASEHDQSLLDQVAHGTDRKPDLWLLDHAKSCATCASHSTLNQALLTNDHPPDYKPWRSHPAWLDVSQIQRSITNLETTRKQLFATASKTQDSLQSLSQEEAVANDYRTFLKMY